MTRFLQQLGEAKTLSQCGTEKYLVLTRYETSRFQVKGMECDSGCF